MTDIIWAPWRMDYIRRPEKEESCIFCDAFVDGRGEAEMLLHRGVDYCVLMNKYPYTNAHLLVSPRKHAESLGELSPEELSTLFLAVARAEGLIREVLNPDGLNVGMNLGKVAGAGFDDHIHVHIVPRWNGDNSFMPVIADTRYINQYVIETRAELLPHAPKFFLPS
ncbi:HIT domain-containing protein [Thermodesulfobacteriota bacterium]